MRFLICVHIGPLSRQGGLALLAKMCCIQLVIILMSNYVNVYAMSIIKLSLKGIGHVHLVKNVSYM